MATKVSTVKDTLTKLYSLQLIDSKIDRIEILKGALPIEVRDLEDDIAGLEKRLNKLTDALSEIERDISQHTVNIKESETLIARYEKQLDEVKNNREFDALTKEIELQKLEIQLSEKKIRNAEKIREAKKEGEDGTKDLFEQKKEELKVKQVELEKIIEKTNQEEEVLNGRSEKAQKSINSINARLLSSYKRIRNRYRNGLAVVTVTREACGGCFARIPPQVQIEIGMRKDVVACEHCGRVLIDNELADKLDVKEAKVK